MFAGLAPWCGHQKSYRFGRNPLSDAVTVRLTNLEVSDEGSFWETGDRAVLEAKMRLLNEKMAWLAGELSSGRFADRTGLSAEDIAARIEDFLRKNSHRSSVGALPIERS